MEMDLSGQKMNREYVRVAAAVSRITTMADNTIRITFDTQELQGETFAALFKLKNQIGHLIFAPENTEIEIPDYDPVDFRKQGQTPSQKLRAVIFVQWQSSDKSMKFDDYYIFRMRQIVEREKLSINAP
jgi:hypothetical protein